MSNSVNCHNEYDIVDFHSHILPGADHGSDDLKTSLIQIELAQKKGINRILATPHFYPNQHNVLDFLKLRDECASELKSAIPSDLTEVKLGAEVLICDGLEKLPNLDKLCFPGTNYIMIELPFFDFSENMAITIEAITEQGLNVILAHADRYPKNTIEFLLDYGVKTLQINADSLAGIFKKKHIYKWLEKGFVGMIGSDMHGTDKSTYHKFSVARKRIARFLPYIKESSDYLWSQIESIK